MKTGHLKIPKSFLWQQFLLGNYGILEGTRRQQPDGHCEPLAQTTMRTLKFPERCLPRAWLEGGCGVSTRSMSIGIEPIIWEGKGYAKISAWNIDGSRVPVDPKESAIGWSMLTAMVQFEVKPVMSVKQIEEMLKLYNARLNRLPPVVG